MTDEKPPGPGDERDADPFDELLRGHADRGEAGPEADRLEPGGPVADGSVADGPGDTGDEPTESAHDDAGEERDSAGLDGAEPDSAELDGSEADAAQTPPAAASGRTKRRTSVVGVSGEILITLGVVVMLFIGWQQWFNDIVVSNQNRNEANKISESFHRSASAAPTVKPNADGEYGTPTVTAKPKEDDAFGVLYVPRFGADYKVPIAEGTTTSGVLDLGDAGHYDTTQMPGAVGNFAVAGHRTTHGAPFGDIANLRVGDHIYVQTKDGYYTYTFRNLQYVKPTQVQVLQQVPDAPSIGVASKDRLITLTSCNPRFSAAERIIAYGVFTSWQPLSASAPTEIKTIVGKA